MTNGKIIKVSGPLVVAEGLSHANMFDVVRVGRDRLIGEIIEMRGDRASIQVYEETAGIGYGDEVITTGAPLSVELAPGLIENIYDGIQRPLEKIREICGSNIKRGIEVTNVDRERVWDFKAVKKVGDEVSGGDIIGTVQETVIVEHRVMVPHGISGEIVEITSGSFRVEDTVCKIKKVDGSIAEVAMLQKWPVRIGRPYKEKMPPDVPMITGQRVIDTMFPIAKGGAAAVPGPFGCGERGNEMTDVLREFPELRDPKTGESLMKRTVLIANTSDMPVAAREASIYTGITIAEYYRDMGYDVAVIADSTSRWAEALREMSGRLEEMPGEEGYPAYLSSRLAQFYERAGRIYAACGEERLGSLTAIGAVSPPGGDISEPVAQATLRIVKVFWGLDSSLAYSRHFPAINWLNSYSLYLDRLGSWFDENVSREFMKNRGAAMNLLQLEAELQEIVRLVGIDALSADDRLTLEVAQIVREDFLQQNAFSDTDSYTPLQKQARLMSLVLRYYELGKKEIAAGVEPKKVFAMQAREKIGRAKDAPNDSYNKVYDEIEALMESEADKLIAEKEAE